MEIVLQGVIQMIHWASYLLSQERTDPTPERSGSREHIYARERMLERLRLRDRAMAQRPRRRYRAIRRLAAHVLCRVSALLASTAEWLTPSDTVESLR
jgi:hypothetical protein